jgi:23S rRNA (guanosine2251-2'-O)-methyltransferase
MRKLQVEELKRPDIETFKAISKIPVILVLDNIRSGHNVGAAFRTSDAFALKCIYLIGITATPPNKEIHKTALGATDSVDWFYFSSPFEAINDLRKQGFKIIGVEQTTESIFLQDVQFESEEKVAIVLGNEVEGISEDMVAQLDLCVEIPQWGTKHSLNVSVCTGIVLWDYLMKTGHINKS